VRSALRCSSTQEGGALPSFRPALALLALALALASCGGEGAAADPATGGPSASLWVTRDLGSEIVLTTEVPAGVTVLHALKRKADVQTAYGGRFVQSIDGIEGSLTDQHDWFFFVNGIEADLGAAEVTLHAGDVAWWDHRDWSERMQQPIVVGAFPEPFLHGWNGERRPAQVRAPPELQAEAAALLETLGGGGGEDKPNVFVLAVENGASGAMLTAKRGGRNDSPVTFTLAGSLDAVRSAATALAADPTIVRFLYEARFDEHGQVVR
jgi:hypothetical protein